MEDPGPMLLYMDLVLERPLGAMFGAELARVNRGPIAMADYTSQGEYTVLVEIARFTSAPHALQLC